MLLLHFLFESSYTVPNINKMGHIKAKIWLKRLVQYTKKEVKFTFILTPKFYTTFEEHHLSFLQWINYTVPIIAPIQYTVKL